MTNDPPVFDLPTALAFMPEQGVRRVANGFRRTADDIRGDLSVVASRINSHDSQTDWDELRRLAHSLKSSAAYLGGEALRATAETVETKAANHVNDEIMEQVTNLDEQLARFCEAIASWLDDEGARS